MGWEGEAPTPSRGPWGHAVFLSGGGDLGYEGDIQVQLQAGSSPAPGGAVSGPSFLIGRGLGFLPHSVPGWALGPAGAD